MSDIPAQIAALELRIARQYASRTEVEELTEKVDNTVLTTTRLETSLEGIKTNLGEVKASIDKLFWTIIGTVFIGVVLYISPWG